MNENVQNFHQDLTVNAIMPNDDALALLKKVSAERGSNNAQVIALDCTLEFERL